MLWNCTEIALLFIYQYLLSFQGWQGCISIGKPPYFSWCRVVVVAIVVATGRLTMGPRGSCILTSFLSDCVTRGTTRPIQMGQGGGELKRKLAASICDSACSARMPCHVRMYCHREEIAISWGRWSSHWMKRIFYNKLSNKRISKARAESLLWLLDFTLKLIDEAFHFIYLSFISICGCIKLSQW